MNTHPLLTPPVDVLRTQVVAAVERHLVRPAASRPLTRRNLADVAALSQQALDAILTRQFRVGPLPAEPIYAELLDRVARRVRRGERIFITIGYGPLKNQNAVPYSRADWAELFALAHLAALHNKVQAVYPPGLQFRIVFDDSTLLIANRVDRRLINSYIASIGTLIHELGYQGLFLPTLRQSAFSWILNFGFYQVAARRVRNWEADPANREKLAEMHASARRNLSLPDTLGEEESNRQSAEAAHRYRIYWEALQLSGLTKGRNRIVGMYLDGTQHHIPQTVALHLTTLDKGQVTQPWQGEGMLLDNGHGKLEPFVMTAGRRPRYETHVVGGLNSVALPGFDRMSVAVPAESDAAR
jgi:hypothetical protein